MTGRRKNGREEPDPDMSRYLTLRQMIDALSDVGLSVSYRSLLKEAQAEGEAVAAGKISQDDARFLMYYGVRYVHCTRYCRSHGIDPESVCPPEEKRKGGT